MPIYFDINQRFLALTYTQLKLYIQRRKKVNILKLGIYCICYTVKNHLRSRISGEKNIDTFNCIL
jgi:hypothetical protein